MHCVSCNVCHCEPVTDVTGVAIRFPRRRGFYVSDGVLSANSGRKYPKNAAKTKVLGSFSRWKCCPHRYTLTPRTGICKICTLLSHGLCAAIRWPLTRARAALAQQGYPLRLSFSGQRCRLLRSSIGKRRVGVGLPDDPPGLASQFLQCLSKKCKKQTGHPVCFPLLPLSLLLCCPQFCGFSPSDRMPSVSRMRPFSTISS